MVVAVPEAVKGLVKGKVPDDIECGELGLVSVLKVTNCSSGPWLSNRHDLDCKTYVEPAHHVESLTTIITLLFESSDE